MLVQILPYLKNNNIRWIYDKEIVKEDVMVRWTTLMGNPEAKENDQLTIAKVAIYNNGEVFSERKINFAKNAIEIINDSMNIP